MIPFEETIHSKEELIAECRKGLEEFQNKNITKNDFCMYFGFTHGEAITKYYSSYGQLLVDGGFNTGSEAYFYGGINAWKNLRDGKYTFPPLKNKCTNDSTIHSAPLQKIFFGSPGTGKSFSVKTKVLNGISDEFIFRTTFHPDSDYASFVGCYKPRMNGGKIEYAFTPQVFTKAYCKAWKNPQKQIFLVIEELNRGNCAQIFGDLFQLLDRSNGVSEYPIDVDEDMKDYLETALKDISNGEQDGSEGIAGGKLRLPANFNIVATMNTSDQSLFPMDSAFKRRWDWAYVPTKSSYDKSWKMVLDFEKDKTDAQKSKIIAGEYTYFWSDFLEAINKRILSATHSEDKQLGFWFVTPKQDSDISISEFVSKVVFYLWNDIFKDMGPKESNPFTITGENGEKTVLNFNSFFEDNEYGETVESYGVLHTFFSNLGLIPEPVRRTASETESTEEDTSEDSAE